MKSIFNKLLVFLGFRKPLGPGLWQQLDDSNRVKYTGYIPKDIILSAIAEFQKGKNYNSYTPKVKYVPRYIQMTREEVLDLKDGDICYIDSSYGMQKTSYPDLAGDTHRNLFGEGGANKTVEQKRDFGPIYKLNEDYGK